MQTLKAQFQFINMLIRVNSFNLNKFLASVYFFIHSIAVR